MSIPKNWCIQGSLNLGKWIKEKEIETCSTIKIAGTQIDWIYFPIKEDLSQWNGFAFSESIEVSKYTLITFEQFEKYILNKQTDVPQDYKYLVKFLKKLGIK